MRVIGTALALSFGLVCTAEADENVIKVTAERSTNLVGKADSATQVTVGKKQLQQRPLLRPGELLETIPGLIVTQHSGSGKANQFFLRGFNLDHGTDFATSLDGMPINMPTHGHGHGYTDLNFIIPELLGGISYRKGSYSAAQGDFSSAGSAELRLVDNLNNGQTELAGGSFGFQRFLLANQVEQRNNGSVLYGLELLGYDGPWKVPEKFRKTNGVLRYSGGDAKATFNLTGMAYEGNWNATDQIPQRAIDSGMLDRFGTIDGSNGGKSHRYSLSGYRWWPSAGEHLWPASAPRSHQRGWAL